MGTLQFIGWLKFHLDRRTFEGCVWVNKEQQMFKILWPRADKNLTPDKLGVMFKWWTHKFGNTRNHNQPTAIKGNFRSCLNSKVQSKEIKKLKTMENRSDGDDWKVFQFTENLKDNVRNPPGHKKSKQQRNMIADPTESETDPEGNHARYDPGEFYADDSIRAEYDDVIQGTRPWRVHISAFAKKRTKLWEYTFDYRTEEMGKRKLHVYVKGNNQRKMDMIPPFFSRFLPNLDFTTVNNDYPIHSSTHEFLTKEFNDGAKPHKVHTLEDTFCPGFIFEVDKNFNIFITRLGQSRLYFGHHGEQNQWQKLEKVKNEQSYMETEEHKDGVKQMVFSYKKFLHSAKVYETWLSNEKPAMDLIDYRVLMPVDTTPRMGMGCDGDCNFYFEIEHLPAKSIFTTIKRLEEGRGNEIFISEDPFADEFANMSLQEPKPDPGYMVYPDSSGADPQVVIKQQPVVSPPSYNDSQVYANAMVGSQYGPGPFDNPGPNVWATQHQQFQQITPQHFSTTAVPQKPVEQLLHEKMLKEGHYHAGHFPTSPMSQVQGAGSSQFSQVQGAGSSQYSQVQGAGSSQYSQVQGAGCSQYPGGYGTEQFMADIDVNPAESCESSWSENALSPMSDHTLIGSPYATDVIYNEPEFCLRTPDCNCAQCCARRGNDGGI
ncbi:hypothetical protein ACHWQZ_G002886 [Mnemiopsis leidyi]